MSLQEKAEAYFSSMNSMANRMCVDMKETKLAYETLWDTFSSEEQEELLNQTIIKPEVSMKYPSLDEKEEYSSEYAVKVVIDDQFSYRDEHSGPFSFKSSSQRDLSIFPRKAKENVMIRSNMSKASNKSTNQTQLVHEENLYNENVMSIDEVDSTSLTHILPKTGLDLLDNW